MRKTKIKGLVAAGIATAFVSGMFSSMAAFGAQTSDTVGQQPLYPALPAVSKVITTNPGTVLAARTWNMTVTLNGQVEGSTLVDPMTGSATLTNSQVVTVPVSTPTVTAVAAPCESNAGVFTLPLTPAGCDMSASMPGVQVGAEASIFAEANMAGPASGAGDGIAAVASTWPATKFGWAHPGQYQYTITESSSYSPVAATGTDAETIVTDNESYVLVVNVAMDDQGNLYVLDAAASYGEPNTSGSPALPGHPDTPGTPGTEGSKVDGTPETPGTPGTPGEPGYPGTPGHGGTDGIPLSDIAFSNLVTVTAGNPTDPARGDGGIDVQKTVAGDLGDHTKLFDVKVVPTAPAVQSESVTANGYLAVVLNSDGSYVAAPVDATGTAIALAGAALQTVSGAGVFVVPSTGIDMGLISGQSLHFINAAYGTGFTGTDNPTANYTPSGTITLGGGTVDLATGVQMLPYTAGVTSLPVGAQGTPLANEAPFISTQGGANALVFTNTYNSVSLTGILIDNLPYVLAIGLVLGAGVVYVVAKSRRRRVRAVRV